MTPTIDWNRIVYVLALVLGAALLIALPVFAAGPISLDGQFADWSGQATIGDPEGDASGAGTDIKAFYFATNPDDETAYFMAERYGGGGPPVTYKLFIDTNDDGNYADAGDRMGEIIYKPEGNGSDVTLTLYDGAGNLIETLADNVDWGEAKSEGGTRVEWGIAFDELGVAPFQTISMRLESSPGHSGGPTADASAAVQWSPADILGAPLLLVLLIGGGVWFSIRRRTTA